MEEARIDFLAEYDEVCTKEEQIQALRAMLSKYPYKSDNVKNKNSLEHAWKTGTTIVSQRNKSRKLWER